MQKNKLESVSLLVLFVGVSSLLFLVFAPFFSILSLAVVLAILLHRPYERLAKSFGGLRSFAAIVTVGTTLAFFIIPLFFLGWQMLSDAQHIYVSLSQNGTQYIFSMQKFIEDVAHRVFPWFRFDVYAYVQGILAIVSNDLGPVVYQTFYVIFETFLMLLALFFFLRDGDTLLSSFVEVSPLGKTMTREILDNMYRTIESVIKGTVVNAFIRWMGIWIAFSLFGIPNALLWSSLGGIIGAIPGLGTPFAFIPAVAYLLLFGMTFSALGLALSGIAIIILVDNVLTSYFFGRGLSVSPIFVLFSILGGVVFFGPLGFILGPLVLSIFLSVVRVYGRVEKKA